MSNLDAASLFKVPGLVAVITGGGTGLGLMAAKALDANGAKAVYIIGRRKESLEKAAAQAINGTIRPLVGDVTSKDSLENVARIIKEEIGYVNVVFANSGVAGSSAIRDLGPDYNLKDFKEKLWETDMKDFNQVFEVNITGAFYTGLAFLELLDEGNRRAVVPQTSQFVITLSAGSFNRIGMAGINYNASKAGALHLMKLMSTALARFKIRVNAIAPGVFPSEMSEGVAHMFAESIPLKRVGNERDFAGVVLFLMSEAGSFYSGAHLLIDGGRTSVMPAAY